MMGAHSEGVLFGTGDAMDPRHLLGGLPHHLPGGALGDPRPARQQIRERRQLRERRQIVLGFGLTQCQWGTGVHELLRQLHLGTTRRIAAAGDHDVVFTPLDGGSRGRHGL